MMRPPSDGPKAKVKSLLNNWPTAKALAYVVDDAGWGVRERLGRIYSQSGSTHQGVATDRSVDYIEEVFNDYRTYGALDPFYGRAAEVGPGTTQAWPCCSRPLAVKRSS